ncbi:hypothetical protein R1flu_019411 [Riccia fluitans]|uniref:Uncharacterized protein n=1 Tax=Riccia fluitans TaxID=41844 RepID=A0ABD1ZIK6_9MARC
MKNAFKFTAHLVLVDVDTGVYRHRENSRNGVLPFGEKPHYFHRSFNLSSIFSTSHEQFQNLLHIAVVFS